MGLFRLVKWVRILAILCVPWTTQAAEIFVTYHERIYTLSATFEVSADPAAVMAILTDYDNIEHLNAAIVESERLPRVVEGGERIRTVVKDCVLFFCKRITRVQDVTQTKNEKLEARIVAALSDLDAGKTEWDLAPTSTGTIVRYYATMRPKFWVPPLVRSYVLVKKFRARVGETVDQLLKIAASRA